MGSFENCIRSRRDLAGPARAEIGAAGAPRPAARCHLDRKPAGLRLRHRSRDLVDLCAARKRRDCCRHRRIRIEPQDDSASRGRHHQANPGRGRRRRPCRTNDDLAGGHQGPRRSPEPARPVVGSDGARSAAAGGTARRRSGVVSGRAGEGAEGQPAGGGGPCGPARHLRNAPAGLSIASGRKPGKEVAGGKRDRGPQGAGKRGLKAHRNRPRGSGDRRHARQQGT